MKESYIEYITVLLKKCDDLPLLDIICQLLKKNAEQDGYIGKRIAYGMNLEFHPSVEEIYKAEKTFIDSIENNGGIMDEVTMRSALTAVWIAGRVYQHVRMEKSKISSTKG